MRVPASHDFTRHYIDVANLTSDLRPFITAYHQLNCFYCLRGQVDRIRNASITVLQRYHLSAQERLLADNAVAPAIFGQHVQNLINTLNHDDRESLFGGRLMTDRMRQLDGVTLGEFLDERVQEADAKELIGVTTGLEVWWDKALTMFLRDELTFSSIGLEELAGGMETLPTKLADLRCRPFIKFNTEVVSISLASGGPVVRTKPVDKSGPVETHEPDCVICTIPFSVLRRIEMNGFSHLKMRAIRNLNYGSSSKVLLHTKSRFWEQGGPDTKIIGGASFSDGISRATYYPSDSFSQAPASFASSNARNPTPIQTIGAGSYTSYVSKDTFVSHGFAGAEGVGEFDAHAWTPPTREGVLVGSYNWGRDARRLGALSRQERPEAVMDAIEAFHPNIRQEVQDADSIYWDEDRWARGAFCFMAPGDLTHYYHDSIRAEGRVHFAGEHCSLDQAWIQGAVMSGLRSVEEILTS